MGGGSAIEDAGTLAELLAPCKTAQDTSVAVHAYEALRRQRCERLQEMARENCGLFTLPGQYFLNH